jgi:hypothetical protein
MLCNWHKVLFAPLNKSLLSFQDNVFGISRFELSRICHKIFVIARKPIGGRLLICGKISLEEIRGSLEGSFSTGKTQTPLFISKRKEAEYFTNAKKPIEFCEFQLTPYRAQNYRFRHYFILDWVIIRYYSYF